MLSRRIFTPGEWRFELCNMDEATFAVVVSTGNSCCGNFSQRSAGGGKEVEMNHLEIMVVNFENVEN
jgi:hypothetical protein